MIEEEEAFNLCFSLSVEKPPSFGCVVRELDVPGELYERKTYPFEFSTVEMPYETYSGANVRLRSITIPHCHHSTVGIW
ncbi:vacuolar protein sorting-associated protein 26A-like protein [Tanacetum coccineum]